MDVSFSSKLIETELPFVTNKRQELQQKSHSALVLSGSLLAPLEATAAGFQSQTTSVGVHVEVG